MSRTVFAISTSKPAIRALRCSWPQEASIAPASPSPAGIIDFERRSATAAMHMDLSPLQPGKELKIPHTVPITPTSGAVAATVPRVRRPRAKRPCTSAAVRSAACCAKVTRQFILGWTPIRAVLFQNGLPDGVQDLIAELSIANDIAAQRPPVPNSRYGPPLKERGPRASRVLR